MRKYLLLSLPILILMGCVGVGHVGEPDRQLNERDKECAVYAALIKGMYANDETNLIVIENNTLPINLIGEAWDETALRISRSMPDVLQETLTDFKRKNEQSQPFDTTCNLDTKYALINKEEKRAIYENQGWYTFYAKYPKAQGIMRLTKVGFSRDMKQSLACVQNQSGYNTGEGFCVLLIKENGVWTIKDKYQWMVS